MSRKGIEGADFEAAGSIVPALAHLEHSAPHPSRGDKSAGQTPKTGEEEQPKR